MANFYKNFTSDTLMSFGKSFARLNGQPLDKSAIWYSKAEADAYAATGSAYVGQPVAVIDETNKKTTLYIVGANSTLEQVGIIPSGDAKTIEVTAAGAISLLGAASAADGTLPMLENGALVWKTLEQIGAGDGNDNTTYEFSLMENEGGEAYGIKVQVIENGVAAGDPIELALNVYTKSEIDATVEGLEGRIKTLEDAEDKDTTYSVKEGDKVLALDGTEFSTTIGLKHENGMISLTGIGGEVIAEFSDADFIKDSVLEDVNYNAETKEIEFTWKTVDGETKTDAVSVADFVEVYTAGNGLELSGNEFVVKVDAASESFLSVGEAGLKLAGVQDAIDSAADAAKSGALTEVANNYYNKTEVYNKEEVYNKSEVYAKSEVYTKGEADKAIADKITEVNGGESAGEVLGQLTAYQKIVNMEVWGNETAEGDSRIDTLASEVLALQNVGSQANVIETVKVNGAALVVSEKAVDIAVPTMLSQLDGYTGIDERIAAAQNSANGAQTTANEAKGAAATNANAIAALTLRVEDNEAKKGDHESRIIVLENANTQHAAEYSALAEIVGGHTAALATKAEQTAVDAVVASAATNAAAIKAINETTIPALSEEIGKKADAAEVYTKAEIGTIAEGKTIVKMIEEAQAAATYDDTGIKALISAEETRALAAEGALAGRLDTVEEFFAAVETPDEVINTLAEIVSYIESDKSGAAQMAANIKSNSDAILAINDESTGILAQAKKYTDDSIVALPFATAEKAGLVKSSAAMNGVAVAADGTMEVNQISVSKLYVADDEELVLNGGNAGANA